MATPNSEKSYVLVAQHAATLAPGRVTVNPRNAANPTAGPVSDLLYAGFLEHLGRCIYGGIVDSPKQPSPPDLLEPADKGDPLTAGRLGWRKDVMDLISKQGDLEIPMLRWPGGNFVSNYHWQDGIGPVHKRPRRIELAWLSDECNMFGTDEFIDYCRATGCEPYICLNMGTGTLSDALAWLEYCNGTGDTHWANLRRANTGRHEPHNVKYWGLGNEMWGPWQVGNMRAADYAEKARIWAHGLRLVDPTIKLVSCGREGNDEWDEIVLKALIGSIDMHSIHFYTCLGHEKVKEATVAEYERNVFGPAAAERSIALCQAMIDRINIERCQKGEGVRPVKIAFDEWNIWDEVKAPGSRGLEQAYDYTDMLGFVAWLNLLVRNHDSLGLACLAQTVNVISPIMTSPMAVLKQTTYYPLRLFSRYMKEGHLLHLDPTRDVYSGATYPAWIQHVCPPTYIDMCAIAVPDDQDAKGVSIRISILNRHPAADWQFDMRLDDFQLQKSEVHEMYSTDLSATNTFDEPYNVVPRVQKYDASEWRAERTIKAHSWQFYILTGNLV